MHDGLGDGRPQNGTPASKGNPLCGPLWARPCPRSAAGAAGSQHAAGSRLDGSAFLRSLSGLFKR